MISITQNWRVELTGLTSDTQWTDFALDRNKRSGATLDTISTVARLAIGLTHFLIFSLLLLEDKTCCCGQSVSRPALKEKPHSPGYIFRLYFLIYIQVRGLAPHHGSDRSGRGSSRRLGSVRGEICRGPWPLSGSCSRALVCRTRHDHGDRKQSPGTRGTVLKLILIQRCRMTETGQHQRPVCTGLPVPQRRPWYRLGAL